MLFIPLLYSVIAHEVSHGFVAYLFGDDTAKREGRLSLNPLVHIDLLGMIFLFLVGFGWAKPVPVNYHQIKNFRIGLIFVSLAGCFTNILIATLAILLLQIPYINSNEIFKTVLLIVSKINIILGAFNLLPIPPLDGSKVLMGFLPARLQRFFLLIEPFGLFLLFILLFTGVIDPAISFIQKQILKLISVLLMLKGPANF